MPNRKRRIWTACSKCSVRMLWPQSTRKPPRCIDCGIKDMVKHNQEMHDKKGEAYDAWRNSMLKYAAGLTPPTPPPDE